MLSGKPVKTETIKIVFVRGFFSCLDSNGPFNASHTLFPLGYLSNAEIWSQLVIVFFLVTHTWSYLVFFVRVWQVKTVVGKRIQKFWSHLVTPGHTLPVFYVQ